AGESEPSSWNFSQESFADGAVLIAAFRNAADDTPTVAKTSTSSTASVPTPGITPPSPASVEIRIASGNSAGNTVSWTPPAGLEEKADVQSTTYVAATLATRDLDSTTPTGTETITASMALEFAAGFTIGIAGAGTSTVDATATPVVVEGSATIPAPTVSAGATAQAALVEASASVPEPTATSSATAAPETVSASATVPSPSVSGSSTASADAVQATAAVPSPSVSVGSTATPETVQASASIPAPTSAAGATAAPPVVQASASIPSVQA